MSNIIWKTIPDYPNYEASNDGRIRRALNGRELKTQYQDMRKYCQVSLFYNKKKYLKKVARLVWAAFNGCDCALTIDHIDKDKSNNHISNLRCVSNIENLQTRTIYRKKTNQYNLTIEDKIKIVSKYRNKEWSTWDISKLYGIPPNYLQITFKRGSWDKLVWKESLKKDIENI